MKINRVTVLVVVGLVSALCVVPAWAAIDPTKEGYDLMRQITSQQVPPNVLIVLDVSGSMAWDEARAHTPSGGVDATGTYLTAEWEAFFPSRPSCDATYTNCKKWGKRLKVYQGHASRMATVKNALGSHVEIITAWVAPADDEWPGFPAAWTAGTVTGPAVPTPNPATSGDEWYYEFEWRVTYNSAQPDPGNPFDLADLTAQPPNLGSGARLQAPGDVIKDSKNKINWGLQVFSSECADCDEAMLLVAPDSNNRGDVSKIIAYLKLHATTTTIDGVDYEGLGASGGTPTIGALEFARTVISAVAAGGTVTTHDGCDPAGFDDEQTFTISRDPELSCGRKYGVILVTDGLSNTCNPGDGGNWEDPCLTCSRNGDPGCPDGGPSGYDCPNEPDRFLAGKAEDLWDLAAGGRNLLTRTWVIGISEQVGPCELNYTAYLGRTDAAAVDAGMKLDASNRPKDCWLPGAVEETCNSDPKPNPVSKIGQYDAPSCPASKPPHGNYAFFPKSAKALKDAIEAITGALGSGDYTSASPTVAGGAVMGSDFGFVTSATYPGFTGHVYAYDLKADCVVIAGHANEVTQNWDCRPTRPCGWTYTDGGVTQKAFCRWDAGEVLSRGGLNEDGTLTTPGTRKAKNNGFARRMYTWNASTNVMTKLATDDTTVDTINANCGGCLGATTADAKKVVDFIMGNDGNGTERSWKLGAALNATAAVVKAPEMWQQNTMDSHTSFETVYEARHTMLWTGTSDGMLHGIDVFDGVEIIALLPPTMLARQESLYQNYVADPLVSPVGEPRYADSHIYGVSNSARYGDVWFEDTVTPANSTYKTVLFVTEGPGGTGVHAIDVTHPYPGRDINGKNGIEPPYESTDPNFPTTAGAAGVEVLWTKDRTNIADLGYTWSMPAVGGDSGKQWHLLLGGGWDERLTTSDSPKSLRLDPTDGSVLGNQTLTQQNGSALVRSQAFADSVIWQKNSPAFKQDNQVDEGVQADLNGRLWKVEASSWGASVLYDLGAANPMYYPPAVAGYPATQGGLATHALYAFTTGSFYETSPNVTGPDVGHSPNFIPQLLVASRQLSGSPTSPVGFPLTNIVVEGSTGTLGDRTQVLTAPMIFVSVSGATAPTAAFLVYDPSEGCAGTSYYVSAEIDPLTITNSTVGQAVFMSEGALGGMAVAPSGKVIASHSDPREGGRAYVLLTPKTVSQYGKAHKVNWWRELM